MNEIWLREAGTYIHGSWGCFRTGLGVLGDPSPLQTDFLSFQRKVMMGSGEEGLERGSESILGTRVRVWASWGRNYRYFFFFFYKGTPVISREGADRRE